ncbi:histone acetyltransferase, partial [Sarracenia purpurea var. burkii]
MQQKTSNGRKNDLNNHLKIDCYGVEVILVVGTVLIGHLYSRLVPLVLPASSSTNPIDITDPRWEILLIVQKKIDNQILVLPLYQHKGCSRYLLEVLNNLAISEYVGDLTVEEPGDSLQRDSAAGNKLTKFPIDYDEEMAFVVFKSKTIDANRIELDENQNNQEKQLKQL